MSTRNCPICGAPIPAGSPEGQCVVCLLELPEDGQAHPAHAARDNLRTEQPGDFIGRYKLLQKIGEGGCGVVYMAEQEEPVRRRVALKIIKLGMDTRQVVARFEAERQALAMMDHPNIAKVFDAGATQTGRPYFVMELVRGIRITDYCDQCHLSTRDRLDLFTKVCQAIQHAHQKGIVHRDIKPSNILIALHDSVPVPKVIDFGIAKATEARLTDKTLFTAFQEIIGTPAYMSPEQAELSGLDIDTRSDIYSLGVLLYELLTGSTPFDQRALLAAGLDEMRRRIREEEPVRPSTRLTSLAHAELAAVARHRCLDPPRLIHLVRGDLDWIVMKCLEKDRTRRYETANGLASDVQRHLKHELILARPPSTIYRFQRLVQRNKLAVLATGAVFAALMMGLGLSTWLFIQERKARREIEIARQNEARLRLQAERAEGAMIGNLAGELRGQGKLEQAETKFREALTLETNLLGADHALVATLLNSLAGVQHDRHKMDEAEKTYRQALQINRGLWKDSPVKLTANLIALADVLEHLRRGADAEALYREALALARASPGQGGVELALPARRLAAFLRKDNRTQEAESNLLASVTLLEKMPRADATALSETYDFLFRIYNDSKHQEKALEYDVKRSQALDRISHAESTESPPVLLAHWPFENNADDAVSANHAQAVGQVEFTAGVKGQCVSIGREGSVAVSNPPSPRTMSIATWVRFDSLEAHAPQAGQQIVLFRRNSHTVNFEGFALGKMRTESRDHFCFSLTSYHKDHDRADSTNSIASGQWYHVVGTFDGRWIRLYVDGVRHGVAYHPHAIDYGLRPMVFGSSGESWDAHFVGSLDEVRLYEGALSANEVQALYQSQRKDGMSR